MSDPFRKIDEVERKARNIAKKPGREAKKVQNQARRAKRMPGMKARRAKNKALRPFRKAKGQMRRMQGRGRRYKRYAGRMSGTDFMISAMLYPFGFILTWFAGFVDDWDTQFIRYNLVHARMLWVIMLILFPISPLLWIYAWYLGFRAYSGKWIRIPLLSNWAENRGKLDLESAEEE